MTNRETVTDICTEYIDSRRNSVKESTIANYTALLRNHIELHFDGVEADKLTKDEVSSYYKSLVDDGFSAAHIHSIGILLRAAYSYAEDTYGLDNVCKGVYMPKMRKRMITVLTAAEKRKVLRGGDTAAVIALSMGLRIGEVCGLMGQDIEGDILTVSRTVQRIQPCKGETKVIVSQPKTEHSRRQIPIPKHIAPLLKAPADRYIIGGDTQPVEPRMITYHWKKFCRENGMRNINFHTLRHTFATSALEAGVDVKTLSEMLGHASTSTTMDLYCHPTMKHKKDCMKKIWGRGHDQP